MANKLVNPAVIKLPSLDFYNLSIINLRYDLSGMIIILLEFVKRKALVVKWYSANQSFKKVYYNFVTPYKVKLTVKR